MAEFSTKENAFAASDENQETNINHYTTTELVSILNLSNPTETEITAKTDFYINKFKNEGNTKMADFFDDVKIKLLDELIEPGNENIVNEDNPITNDDMDNQTYSFISDQYLENSDKKQDDKTTQRLQAIGIYDNTHNVMKQHKLGISQQHQVPIAQGQLNPTLKNITSRMVSIDSKYRTNSTPSIKNVKYKDIISPHTSSWSSSNYSCNLTETLTNVLNLQMYSISIPYSWYLIDSAYGNTCFKITNTATETEYIINIDDGNYTKQELIKAVNDAIQDKSITGSATYNSNTGKSTIILDNQDYIITFFESGGGISCINTCRSTTTKANNNLGWVLGFRNSNYTADDAVYNSSDNTYSYTSESLVDVYGPRCLVLIVEDYNANHVNKGLISIEKTQSKFGGPLGKKLTDTNLLPLVNCVDTESGFHTAPVYGQGVPKKLTAAQLHTINNTRSEGKDTIDNTLIPPTDSDIFAIIPLKKAIPGDIITEFTTSIQRNERNYFGPVDIGRMNIKLLDDKGNILNLNGMDWSFLIMVQQLYQY